MLEMAGSDGYRQLLLFSLTFDCCDLRHFSCRCRQMDSKENNASDDFSDFTD
jgi:hypothetical protein